MLTLFNVVGYTKVIIQRHHVAQSAVCIIPVNEDTQTLFVHFDFKHRLHCVVILLCYKVKADRVDKKPCTINP